MVKILKCSEMEQPHYSREVDGVSYDYPDEEVIVVEPVLLLVEKPVVINTKLSNLV
jgi:hypothetical protein